MRLDSLAQPVRDVEIQLTDDELLALARVARDGLQRFLVQHAKCLVDMPEALQVWVEEDACSGWCRQCGAMDTPLDVDGDVPVFTWWGMVGVGLLACHRETFTTSEGKPRPLFRAALGRLEEAVRRAALLERADASNVLH
jgi:hypothetical protein